MQFAGVLGRGSNGGFEAVQGVHLESVEAAGHCKARPVQTSTAHHCAGTVTTVCMSWKSLDSQCFERHECLAMCCHVMPCDSDLLYFNSKGEILLFAGAICCEWHGADHGEHDRALSVHSAACAGHEHHPCGPGTPTHPWWGILAPSPKLPILYRSMLFHTEGIDDDDGSPSMLLKDLL